MKEHQLGATLRVGQWLAALIGALNCVLVPALFAEQNAFPLPGLYFIQIILVGLGVLGIVAARPRKGLPWLAWPWAAAGVMLAFVVLGGFSIGPYLVPAFLAFVVTGVLVDLEGGGAMARHAGLLLVAAVIQAAVMVMGTLIT
jgi:hypothetical protein